MHVEVNWPPFSTLIPGEPSFLARNNSCSLCRLSPTYLGISTDDHWLNALKVILNMILAQSVFPVNCYERIFVAVTLKNTFLFNFYDRFRLSFTCHSLPPSWMFPTGSTCATKRLPRTLSLSKNHCRDKTHRRPPSPSSIIQVQQHEESWRAVDWVSQVLYCFQLGQNYFCSPGWYSTNTARKDLEWTLHQTGWPDRRRQRNQGGL